MSNIQLTVNGNIVSGDINEIAQLLGIISSTITGSAPAQHTFDNETFNEFLKRAITPQFGIEASAEIVGRLDDCLRNVFPDFRKFRGMYKHASTIEKRNLLKMVSASYRIKFATYLNDVYLSSLRSEVKYSTICPHCGRIAQEILAQLQREGLI